MKSEIILLSNVEKGNISEEIQKEFGLLGLSDIKGKRIDAEKTAIHKTLAQSVADNNIIMIIGGMGSENDNMTVSAVTSAIGFSTVEIDGEIFPEGAEIFKNKVGKASGCAISQGNQCIMMLPGDEESFRFMLCYRVPKYLCAFMGSNASVKTLRAMNITKEEAEKQIASCETYGVKTAVFEDEDEISVLAVAQGVNKAESKERCNAAIKNIIAALGDAVYAVNAENVGQAFAQELRKKSLKSAIAVDGIHRTEMIKDAYVDEYIGSYLGISKGVDRYDIPEKLIKRHGINSEWTAAFLAGEVCKDRKANIGMSATADPEKFEEGAYIAVCMGDNVWTEHIRAENREELLSLTGKRLVHLARAVAATYPNLLENAVSLKNSVSGKSKFNTSEKTEENTKWYARFIPMKGDSKNERIRKTVFICCVAVFLGCMGYLSTKLFDTVNHKSLAASLKDKFNSSYNVPSEWDYLPELYELYKMNDDLIGYVKIDGTGVDYPVVQTSEKNEKGQTGQYYLRKDYNGQYSMYGTPFLDYRCNAYPIAQSKNLIIYGHNIYDDGQMFADLVKYRKLKFYKEHPVIEFDTLYGENNWLIVGVVLANAYAKDGPIWDYNNFIEGNEEETKDFINQIKKRTLIVTGVDFNTEDHFLTLSTCCYDFTDARFVVIARQAREGEDISAFDPSKAYYNSNPLMPDKWYEALSKAQNSESDASFGEAESTVETSSESEETSTETSSELGKFTVTYKDGANGAAFKDQVFANIEENSETPAFNGTPARPGYKFEGWEPKIVNKVIANATYTARWTQLEYTVIYTDGVDNQEIFADKKAEKLHYGDTTPAFGNNPVREGYTFAGWSPSLSATVTGTVTYVAQWTTNGFTVTYTDGVENETVFEDKVFANLASGTATPEFGSTPSRNGYVFDGWEPSLAATVTGNVTYKAKWKEKTEESHSESSSETSSETSSESYEEEISGEESGEAESLNASGTSRYYQKSLKDKVTLNGTSMSIYDAVCQIVQYEAGYGQPDEHVKAQAVATYTFIKNQGSNLSAGATSPVCDQIKRCVAKVIGYAVLDDKSDKYILATYFSESCGYTADAEWVWGYYNRNLLSVRSSVDGKEGKPYKISSDDFASKVYSKAGISLKGDPSNWIKVVSYWGNTDYVNKISLGGVSYTGRKLRETVLGGSKLRSTAFTVEYDEDADEFIFRTWGYGHGVGLSAVGSIAYANKGYTWDEILLKYYSNCYIAMKY